MKNYQIKDLLKKDLLIVELPEETYYEVFKHGILFKDHLESEREFIEGSFTLLGSPDEIKDEDVKDLVEKITTRQYKNYGYVPHYFQYLLSTALESFHSALEKEILWENPYAEPDKFIDGFDNPCYEWWHEAESRTFDRTRTLIFVENKLKIKT